MKWLECVEDLGDGSTATRRFKDKETAELWRINHMEDYANGDYEEWNCYPLGELQEVDTESKYFWD
jgi:hypothetical protein